MTRWWLSTLLLLSIFYSAYLSADNKAEQESNDSTWWEQRHDRPDLYYPHNLHMQAMEEEGDPCLLCHSFTGNDVVNPDQATALTTIANEPLEAICHSCHLERNSAPFKCDLCHPDPTTIWPANHNYDYIHHHGEDSRLDDGECQSCHMDLSFCTDCHFGRDPSNHQQHRLGYLQVHGIDARMNTRSCARCHNASYCSACHRGTTR